jgi:hypothetical protein
MEISNSNFWNKNTIILFILSIIVAYFSFQDYGLSWDYEAHDTYGRQAAKFYSSFSKDKTAAEVDMKNYGAGFEIFVNVIRKIMSKGDSYEQKQFATFLYGLIGVFGVWAIAKIIYGSRAAFYSSLFLILTPIYYGHSFINHKDLPLAVAYTWAVFAVIYTIKNFEKLSFKESLFCGVTIGWALGIRSGSFFLLPLCYLGWGYGFACSYLNNQSARTNFIKTIVKLFFYSLLTLITSWAVMCVLWPHAFVHPIDAPMISILRSSAYPWSFPIRFNGGIIVPPNIPSTYLATWFLIQTPEFIFLAISLGIYSFFKNVKVFSITILNNKLFWQITFILSSIIIPIIAVILQKSVVYDASRHFLFVNPLIALLAGLAFSYWIDKRNITSEFQSIINNLMLILITFTIGVMVMLHPYQYSYFNYLFGGGLSRAGQRFENDYWATCIKDSYEWLISSYPSTPNRPTKIASWSDPFQLKYYVDKYKNMRADFQFTESEAEANIYITTSRFNGHLKPYKLVNSIDRDGVKLCYIFEK